MFRKLAILAALMILFGNAILAADTVARTGDIAKGFVSPPDSSRAWVNWVWLDGMATKEGITADLESMKRAGIGGVVVMEVSQALPKGPTRFMSPAWRELEKHMLAEAARLGIAVSLNNSGGSSGTGGPWVKPENSMQKVVFSETVVAGPTKVAEQLPQPPTMEGYYRDIAVLAFPTPEGDEVRMADLAVKLTRSDGQKDVNVRKLLDNNPLTALELAKPDANKPDPNSRANFIRFEFARPFSACALKLGTHGAGRTFQGVLQISEDGNSFKDVRGFGVCTPGTMVTFDRITSRYYRIAFTSAGRAGDTITLTEAELFSSPRIADVYGKAAYGRWDGGAAAKGSAVPVGTGIAVASILNLTQLMDATGKLSWDAPKGKWTVIRFGHTSTGEKNATSPVEGVGLECDRLNKEAVSASFGEYAAKILADQAKLSARPVVSVHVGGWEASSQNWTAQFRQEFKARRGYDLLAYLPVLTGRVVGGEEMSERFLWDMRQTVNELMLENYAGTLGQLCRAQGVGLSVDALGDGTFDTLAYAGRADVPMGEFGLSRPDTAEVRPMASAAHVYGKPVTAVQAFKAGVEGGKWLEHPYTFKPLVDQALCNGATRFVFHCFAMQPWLDRKPGVTMGAGGVHYERSVTWWELSRAWHDYVARCQYLLGAGRFVADVCYLRSEDSAGGAFGRVALPGGYDYDECPAELAAAMTVKDGLVVLPSGMSYRVLVLPEQDVMTPALLGKVKELVSAGATVMGPKPVRSPSLKDYPKCDEAVKALAAELWGECDGKAVKERAAGKGKILWNKPLGEVLTGLGAGADFRYEPADPNRAQLSYHHRSVDDADVYFVRNIMPSEANVVGEFRVTGKRAELWWPDSGRMEYVGDAVAGTGGTRVPLQLEPYGTVFVVFRGAALPGPELAAGKVRFGKPVDVAGAWEVAFPTKSGLPDKFTLNKLISWPEIKDVGGKYFSGVATYRKDLQVTDEILAKGTRLYLELGKVQVLAKVKVNDKDLGTLWKPPFRVDITDAAKAGMNAVEIQLANLWPNRLIGDEQLPPDAKWKGQALAEWPRWVLEGKPSPTGRKAFATWMHYKKESPLLESGLMGPVQLVTAVMQVPATSQPASRAASQASSQPVTQPTTTPAKPAITPAATTQPAAGAVKAAAGQ